MKDKLEAIRKTCIEANPEIVELKFGCVVRHTPVKDLGIDYRGVYMHPARGNAMHLLFFEGERTGSQQPYSTTVSEKHFEIIGRPIRLADLLLAMQSKSGWHYAGVESDEFIFEHQGGRYYYNLRLDDLTQQSEECISFLYELLRPAV